MHPRTMKAVRPEMEEAPRQEAKAVHAGAGARERKRCAGSRRPRYSTLLSASIMSMRLSVRLVMRFTTSANASGSTAAST